VLTSSEQGTALCCLGLHLLELGRFGFLLGLQARAQRDWVGGGRGGSGEGGGGGEGGGNQTKSKKGSVHFLSLSLNKH
jgi:hypothetical protein